MEDYRVAGVSLAVINDYQLEWARGMAPSKPATRTRNSGHPLPGRIHGQTLTAVAALRLVERGTLDLDEDVNRFLVSWKSE